MARKHDTPPPKLPGPDQPRCETCGWVMQYLVDLDRVLCSNPHCLRARLDWLERQVREIQGDRKRAHEGERCETASLRSAVADLEIKVRKLRLNLQAGFWTRLRWLFFGWRGGP